MSTREPAAAAKPQPLARYAEAVDNKRNRAWADTVPADIRDEILAHPELSTATIVKWLREEHHLTEATQSKVELLRGRRGARNTTTT